MTNGEGGVASVAEFGWVWGIYGISQEEGISPFLHTQFRLFLLSTTAQSAMPLSLSPAESGMRLGQGNPPGYPTVPLLVAFHSASTSLLSPSLEIRHGTPS